MRLNQAIQSTGYCSRREADDLIVQKRVTVKGEIAVLGMQVDQVEDIQIDGNSLVTKTNKVVILYNKPRGITCTSERHIVGNIIDEINYPERIFPIGRLDKDSEGLILLTNEGQWVNPVLREENGHEKEYRVKLNRPFDDEFLTQMAAGVMIYNPVKNEMVKTRPCVVKKIDSVRFSIILKQGLNRQIRRMCTECGYEVKQLQRERILDFTVGSLRVGEWRLLDEYELKQFQAWISDKAPIDKIKSI